MSLIKDKREIEDEDLRRKFHHKRDEIREEKARREEIEKHRILKVLHELKETEKERQEVLNQEKNDRMKRHQAMRKHEKELLERSDLAQRARVAAEHKRHNEHMYNRLIKALDTAEPHVDKDKTKVMKEIEKIQDKAEDEREKALEDVIIYEKKEYEHGKVKVKVHKVEKVDNDDKKKKKDKKEHYNNSITTASPGIVAHMPKNVHVSNPSKVENETCHCTIF